MHSCYTTFSDRLLNTLKLRSHMRGAFAERRQVDFDIPTRLPRICSHIGGADMGRSAISWGQRWIGGCGFETAVENWVLDPFVAEQILLPLHNVWTHVMICVEAIFPPTSASHMWERTLRCVMRCDDVTYCTMQSVEICRSSAPGWQ